MSSINKAEILELSISERILLVEDIWDSIAEAPDELAISDNQKTELNARLEAYHKNPSEGSPWTEVSLRLRNHSAK